MNLESIYLFIYLFFTCSKFDLLLTELLGIINQIYYLKEKYVWVREMIVLFWLLYILYIAYILVYNVHNWEKNHKNSRLYLQRKINHSFSKYFLSDEMERSHR